MVALHITAPRRDGQVLVTRRQVCALASGADLVAHVGPERARGAGELGHVGGGQKLFGILPRVPADR